MAQKLPSSSYLTSLGAETRKGGRQLPQRGGYRRSGRGRGRRQRWGRAAESWASRLGLPQYCGTPFCRAAMEEARKVCHIGTQWMQNLITLGRVVQAMESSSSSSSILMVSLLDLFS